MSGNGVEGDSSLQFLIAAARGIEGDSPLRMTETDWSALAGTASRQGLTALAARALADRTDAPEDVRREIAATQQTNAMRSLQALSELLRISDVLQASQVTAVVLKGPTFSQWLYGDPACRRFGDLDLLVAPRDRAHAFAALKTLGYDLPDGMSVASARAIYGALGAWPLTGGGSFPLDLHWRLAAIRFAAPLTSRDVIDQSLVLDAGGRRLRIPCATHAALFALLHAAKHLWCTLELIVAIAELTRRPDIDWLTVRGLAKQAHGWHGCATGLRLASELLAAEIPPALVDEPWPATSDALRHEALSALLMPAGVFQDRWIERRAHRAAFDRWGDRVRYDLWRVLAPTPLEWQWCHLPDPLTPLYVPVRLIRLGVGAVRHVARSVHS
jgi:Uncharacterised nucleotidyltransferase